jgi:integrase
MLAKTNQTNNSLTIRPELGQAADQAAAGHVFDDWQARRAENTLRRAQAELGNFAAFLEEINNGETLDLFADPQAWQGITWGLVKAFIQHLLHAGYAIGTINLHLSTVKTFARLASAAGALPTQELALIALVKGYSRKEAARVNEKRQAAGLDTRKGTKKADFTALSRLQAAEIRALPENTPQGLRDRLILALLIELGLRVGELAALQACDFDLDRGRVTFYREKVDMTQTHELSAATMQLLREWLAEHHQGGELPLLRRSRKGGRLGGYGMTTQAISDRVNFYGQQLGIDNLRAHDLRHTWATRAAAAGTDIKHLVNAGGWTGYQRALQYIEAAAVANEGVRV